MILLLAINFGLNTVVKGDEWGWSDSDGFYHRESPMDVIMEFLPIIIVVVVIIIIAVIGVAAIGSVANKSKNNNQSFIPSMPQPPGKTSSLNNKNTSSQYAFRPKKAYCNKCGRLINEDYNICPFCGNDKVDGVK